MALDGENRVHSRGVQAVRDLATITWKPNVSQELCCPILWVMSYIIFSSKPLTLTNPVGKPFSDHLFHLPHLLCL